MSSFLLALFLVASWVPTRDEPIVVEIEQPRQRVPNDGSFARPHPMRWASGREAAIRFHGPGRCTYALDVPNAGTWYVWLRYAAASPVEMAAGFVEDAGAGELPRHAIAASGGLEGKHAWGWKRVFAGDLTAGSHRFALEGAALRPDCLLLTELEGTPSYLTPPPVPDYDEATRAALARPLVAVRPAWLDEAAGYELPTWFMDTRVCMHTRLSPRWLLRDEFTTAAESFASLGAKCFVRHLKTLGEGAWWPSAVGPKEIWASHVDVAGGIIDRAHAADCRLIAYYRHMEDEGMAERHPDWKCVDDRGEPYLRRGGHPMMCFNSPYAQFVEKRLLELVDRGADGFYFDEVHMPPTGCWCEFCRHEFRALTGLDHPTSIDDEDPLYRKLQDFTNLSVERAFLRLRGVLHERQPEVVLLIGSYRSPDFLDRHLTERLLRIADSVKTEFDKGASGRGETLIRNQPTWREPPRDVRLSLGWDYCRDAADGRPPHVWIPRIRSAEAAVFATSAVVAHGGVANLDHPEETLPDAKTFGAAVNIGNLLATVLRDRRPLRWAAVHVPTRTRDRLAPDREAWWTHGHAAMTGAYEALLRERLPVGLVTDSQLAEGDLQGYTVLFLPAPDDLTAEMRRALAGFRERGGLVVVQDEEWAWHEAERFEDARQSFLAALEPRRGDLPFAVRGGPAPVHAMAYTTPGSSSLLLLLVNDFGWVGTAGEASAATPPLAAGMSLEFSPSSAAPHVRELGPEGFRALSPGEDGSVLVPGFPTLSILFIDP